MGFPVLIRRHVYIEPGPWPSTVMILAMNIDFHFHCDCPVWSSEIKYKHLQMFTHKKIGLQRVKACVSVGKASSILSIIGNLAEMPVATFLVPRPECSVSTTEINSCWCHGSLRPKAINSPGIDCVGHTVRLLPVRQISTTSSTVPVPSQCRLQGYDRNCNQWFLYKIYVSDAIYNFVSFLKIIQASKGIPSYIITSSP